ncbi:MAG: UDP-4-amino-4,6-dideoxy-N-acetyl-beta-L-altrosamine N-acetyltransferase [Chloroflexota bacterium]
MSPTPGTVTLRRMAPEDKDRVLAWRNQPDVAAYMFTDHRITPAEHERWFASAMDDGTRRYWIIELDTVPVGLADLTEISAVQKRASVGLYLADPRVRGRGIGAAADLLVIRYAFAELGLEKLSAEVLTTNEAGLKVHLHHGFRVDGILRQHVIKAGRRVDVATLSLLREEWSDPTSSPQA